MQVERIVRTPSRAIRHSPMVNLEVFNPSRCIHSSFVEWSRNIDSFKTSIHRSLVQESNSTSFCTDKISVKPFAGELVTDLDPRKRMNFASSVLRECPKFIDLGLSSVNTTGKPNFFFALLPEQISWTVRREILNSYELMSSHVIERVSEKKAYSNIIKNLNLRLGKFLSGKIFRLKILHWHKKRILWLH